MVGGAHGRGVCGRGVHGREGVHGMETCVAGGMCDKGHA